MKPLQYRWLPLIYFIICGMLFTFCEKINRKQDSKKPKNIKKTDSLQHTLTQNNNWFDVQHYTINITPNITEKKIKGKVTITYKIQRHKNLMQIDLQRPLKADSIFQTGISNKKIREKLTFQTIGNKIYIRFQNKMPINTVAQIEIYYHGKPRENKKAPWGAGGFIWKQDTLGNPFISVTCQHTGASVWFPCKDYLGDEPDRGAQITLNVPHNLSGVSNGKLINTHPVDSHTTAFTWEVQNPINPYNITLYIGKYVHWEEKFFGLQGKLPLSFWVLEENLMKAKTQFLQVQNILRAFEYWFGPYPFYEDGYKLVEAPYLGMEHQSGIAYGNGYQNGYLGKDLSNSGFGKYWDFVIVHETGHEWFGNNISATHPKDFWIHESFTNYSESLFTEFLFGKKAGAAYCKGTRNLILNQKPILNDSALTTYNRDMYDKGGNMLHILRTIINDDKKFIALLHNLNTRFRHKNVTTETFIAYISAFLHYNCFPLFHQYLYTVQIPRLEYVTDKKRQKIFFHLTNCDSAFSIPIRFFNKTIQPNTKEWLSIHLGNNFTDLLYWINYIQYNYYLELKELDYNQNSVFE